MRKAHHLSIALAALTFVATTFAGPQKKKAAEHHDTLIAAVAPTSITITEDKLTRTFPINQSTEVYVHDRKTNVAALQPGMAVSITLAMDGTTASRIQAGDAPVHREKEKVKVSKSFMR